MWLHRLLLVGGLVMALLATVGRCMDPYHDYTYTGAASSSDSPYYEAGSMGESSPLLHQQYDTSHMDGTSSSQYTYYDPGHMGVASSSHYPHYDAAHLDGTSSSYYPQYDAAHTGDTSSSLFQYHPNPTTAADASHYSQALAALVFTDVKLDDLLAIYALATDERYQHGKIVLVLTGIHDTEKAELVVRKFLQDMHSVRGLTIDKDKIAFLKGQSPFYEAIDHEQTWNRLKLDGVEASGKAYNAYELNKLLEDRSVDVFQIAPVTRADMQTLVGQRHNFGIGLFHVTRGYNTRRYETQRTAGQAVSPKDQPSGKLEAEDIEYLHNELKDNHPGSWLIFTDSSDATWQRDTNGKIRGSTQSLERLKERVPQQYIDMAMRDPFPVRQFRRFLEIVPKNMQREWQEAILPRSLRTQGTKYFEYLEHALYQARVKGIKQDHFKTVSEEALAYIREMLQGTSMPERLTTLGGLEKRFAQGMVPMFSEDAVETYDLNHIMAVLETYEGRGGSMQDRKLYDYAAFEQDAKTSIPKLTRADKYELGHKLTPVPADWVQNGLKRWISAVEGMHPLRAP